jgi:uncharacterized protein involved in outer membrane biogenesis
VKWVRRLAIALPVLAVVLAVALVLAPNMLKPLIESAAQRAVGHAVSMGDVMLMPSWPPALQARNVTVEGVGNVARVQAVMAPGSLLSRHPQVLTLRLFGPDVTVANRLPLAAVRKVAAPAEPSSADAPTPSGRPAPAIGRVEIADGHLTWKMPPFGLDLVVSGNATAETTDVTGRGTLTVGSSSIPLDLHISGDPRTSLTAQGTAANATVTAQLAMPGQALDADLTIATPDAAAFGSALGLRYLPHGALKAQAHLDEPARSLADRVVLDRFAMQDDAGDLAGTLTVSYGGRVAVRGKLASQHLDLAALLAPFRGPPAAAKQPAAPAASMAAAPPAPSTVIRDSPFTVPDRFDADLEISAASANWGSSPLGAVSGRAVLRQGRLTLDPLGVTLPGGGPIAAVLRLGGAEPAGLTLHAPAVPLQAVLAAAALPPLVSGNAAVDADLHGRGNTLHQLAASLDGHALLHGTGLEIDSAVLTSLLQATRLKLPASLLGPRTELRCVAVGFDAQQGTLSLAPLVADAALLRIEGAGTIDLADETLALRLRPLLRAGPGIVAPVRIDGPLRAPHVAPDTGGRLAAAVVQTGSSACPEGAPAKLPKPAELLRHLFR